jgi:hypothetical protein
MHDSQWDTSETTGRTAAEQVPQLIAALVTGAGRDAGKRRQLTRWREACPPLGAAAPGAYNCAPAANNCAP